MARGSERPTRLRERVSFDLPDFDSPLVRFDPSELTPTTPRQVAPGRLMGAMAAWFGLILGLCYVASPILRSSLGLLDNVVGHMLFNIPAFLLTAFVVTVGAGVARPSVHLSGRSPRDPVVAATAGGLLTWALVHNISPVLEPFFMMGPAELAAFAVVNVLEMSLIGVMLASFTRSTRTAFALGALVQLLMLGMVSSFVIL